MASAASNIRTNRQRRKKPPQLVSENGRPIPEAHLIEASNRFRERWESDRMSKRMNRVESLPPGRRSVERAMLVVEEAFVKAMWVLQRTEGGDGPFSYANTNGLSYTPDMLDRYVQALANGGWQTPSPRPAIPSSKDITAAEKVQLWVRYLDATQARVLTLGAMSKRGDAGRRVNWIRVRSRLPEFEGYSMRHLQGIYTGALRDIVAELTSTKLNKSLAG